MFPFTPSRTPVIRPSKDGAAPGATPGSTARVKVSGTTSNVTPHAFTPASASRPSSARFMATTAAMTPSPWMDHKSTPSAHQSSGGAYLQQRVSMGRRNILETRNSYEIEEIGELPHELRTRLESSKSPKPKHISALVDPSGLAWVVVGSELLYWPYRVNRYQPPFVEVVEDLPDGGATDVCTAHTVAVVATDILDARTYLLLASTGDGQFILRSTRGADNREGTLELLQGERVIKTVAVFDTHPFKFIVVGDKGSLWSLTYANGNLVTQKSEANKQPSKGFLASWGIRWGSGPQENDRVVKSVLTRRSFGAKREILILTSSSLELWESKQQEDVGEVFLGEYSIRGPICSALKKPDSDDVVLLDVATTGGDMVVALAGEKDEANQYNLSLHVFKLLQTASVTSWLALHHKGEVTDLTAPRLAIPQHSSSHAFVHLRPSSSTSHTVLLCHIIQQQSGDQWRPSGESVLGFGCDDTSAVVMSREGIFKCTQRDQSRGIGFTNVNTPAGAPQMSPFTSMVADGAINESMSNLTGNVTMNLTGNTTLLLGQPLLKKIMSFAPSGEYHHPELAVLLGSEAESRETSVDQLAIDLSLEIVNSMPEADPRYGENMTLSLDATYSLDLLVEQHLERKRDDHIFLIQVVSSVGVQASTLAALLNMHDKLEAALRLRGLQGLWQDDGYDMEILEKAIEELQPPGGRGLRPEDAFYSSVSHIHKLMVEMHRQVKAKRDLQGESDIQMYISQCNSVIIALLGGLNEPLLKQLENCGLGDVFQDRLPALVQEQRRFTPWTAESSIRNLVKDQVELICSCQLTADLVGELEELVYLILEAYTKQMSALATANVPETDDKFSTVNSGFSADRATFIEMFLKSGDTRQAMSIAEKYQDFPRLVEILYSGKVDEADAAAIIEDQCQHKMFREALNQYYTHHKDYRNLFTQSKMFNRDVTEYLQKHPHLLWVHSIRTRNFSECCDALTQVAAAEKQSLRKKSALYAIAKLSACAAGNLDFQSTPDGILSEHQAAYAKWYNEFYPTAMEAKPETESSLEPLKPVTHPVSAKEIINASVELGKIVCQVTMDGDTEPSTRCLAGKLFKAALDICELLGEEREGAMVAVWTASVAAEEPLYSVILQSNFSDQQRLVNLRYTLLYQLASYLTPALWEAVKSQLPLYPDMRKLLDSTYHAAQRQLRQDPFAHGNDREARSEMDMTS